jgi:hypothetical protein
VGDKASYGTIYTTRLLRRGIDVDRAAPWRAFGDMKVREAMQPLGTPLPVPDGQPGEADGQGPDPGLLPGPVTREYDPQVLFSNESVAQALRQLEVYGHDGLPVLSPDGEQILGWDGQTAPCWVEISHDGRYLFTVNTGSGNISSYAIHTGGSLSLMGSTPIRGGGADTDLRLSPDGKTLSVDGSGRETERQKLADAVRRAVDEQLTPRQRKVFVALVLNGVPLDALVAELGTTRNAIYKTMFDARRKLRAALAACGPCGEDFDGLLAAIRSLSP